MRTSGAELVDSLGDVAGCAALDLGCGDGTTAVPLAQRGARVTGIDIARNLVEAGRRRAAALGLSDLRFEQGDASALMGVPDASFDLVLTMFGAMFAPSPVEVARELVRVTRPGGRIVMGNWIPDDASSFVSQLLKVSSAYVPPPPSGFVSPMRWGMPDEVRERFAAAGIPGERVTCSTDVFRFRLSAGTPEQFVELFRRWYGPTMNAYAAAERLGRTAELQTRLVQLAASQAARSGEDLVVPATFLRVTVHR
jgi:SAM-dependent methyltransferase